LTGRGGELSRWRQFYPTAGRGSLRISNQLSAGRTCEESPMRRETRPQLAARTTQAKQESGSHLVQAIRTSGGRPFPEMPTLRVKFGVPSLLAAIHAATSASGCRKGPWNSSPSCGAVCDAAVPDGGKM